MLLAHPTLYWCLNGYHCILWGSSSSQRSPQFKGRYWGSLTHVGPLQPLWVYSNQHQWNCWCRFKDVALGFQGWEGAVSGNSFCHHSCPYPSLSHHMGPPPLLGNTHAMPSPTSYDFPLLSGTLIIGCLLSSWCQYGGPFQGAQISPLVPLCLSHSNMPYDMFETGVVQVAHIYASRAVDQFVHNCWNICHSNNSHF